MKKSSHSIFAFALFLTTLSITAIGCDQVSGLFGGKAKKAEEKVAAPAAQSTETSADPASSSNSTANSKPTGNVLASVGNWSITKEEFDERLKALKEVVPDFKTDEPAAKKLVLDELINQQLLVIEAEQNGTAKSKDIADAVEEFRRTVIVREIARKLTENVKVSDEEAKAFYEEKKDRLIEPEEYHVREIVVDDQLKANEISVDLLKGVDFAEQAKQHSKAKSAANGGDLGFISEPPSPEAAEQIVKLKPGEITPIFKTAEGYTIMKLDEKKGGAQIPFEKIKDEIIKNRMLYKQQQAILDYINQLKEKNKVQVNEDLLK